MRVPEKLKQPTWRGIWIAWSLFWAFIWMLGAFNGNRFSLIMLILSVAAAIRWPAPRRRRVRGQHRVKELEKEPADV